MNKHNIPSHFVDRRWFYILGMALALVFLGAKIGNSMARKRPVTVTVIYGQQPDQFLDCYKRNGEVTRQRTSGPLTDFEVCEEVLYK